MNWEHDLETAWEKIAVTPPVEFVDRITDITDDPSLPHELREFHLACAYDSTGRPDLAVPGYQAALTAGLDGYLGRRAKIQLASSLRNLGYPERGFAILSAEPINVDDGLDDAVVVFLSLTLADLGREREAISALVHSLANHLPRYSASAHRYADVLNARDFGEASSKSQGGVL